MAAVDFDLLLLSGEDLRALVPMDTAVGLVERAFRDHAEERMRMPAKLYLDLPEYEGDFRAMPAASLAPEQRYAGLKWVNVHPGNPGQARGLPAVMGCYILNDASNGMPLALLDGGYLTALRTGAAGGVAVQRLARKDLRIAAFIGAGVQAVRQLEAILCVRQPETIRFYDPSPASARFFEESARTLGDASIQQTDSVEAAVADADLIVCTTPSRRPVLQADQVKPGVHINAIGADAPGKQELDPDLLEQARIFVDDPNQAAHSGEVNVALEQGRLSRSRIQQTLGGVIAGLYAGRESEEEITVFDSTGLAVQDLAVAARAYEEAQKASAGAGAREFARFNLRGR